VPPAEDSQGGGASHGAAAERPPSAIGEVTADQDHPSEPPEQRPGAGTKPLHEPDSYSTPPYGGPGPWAPAPPVQLPTATPAHGTPVPPQGTPAHGTPMPQATPAHGTPMPPRGASTAAPGQGTPTPPPPGPRSGAYPYPEAFPRFQRQAPPGPAQESVAPLRQHGVPQWQRYDPWSSPGAEPLVLEGHEDRPRRRRLVGLTAALVFALLTGVVGGAVGAYVEHKDGLSDVALPQEGKDREGRAPDSVAGIASTTLPGVVTLHVSGADEAGTGTGFVLDRDGHILTNNHVVEPAGSGGEISVTFSSGRTADAKLVGKDSGYDLAVVQVSGMKDLKPLALGNSDNVRVGDPVVAIGAPFDLSNTVTSGIISAKDRPITAGGESGDDSDVSYVDALQTDAPINPGNSGGPLVDSAARVIGINSAIRAADDSGSGTAGGQPGSIGLGFAIPINQAKRVAEELINTGKATHPVIGVTLDTKYEGDGAKVGTKAADGGPAVEAAGPAARAGIRAGDVITAVDGEGVHNGEELIVKIRAHRPGDHLKLTVQRQGTRRTIGLTLGSAEGM
jgi:putative serine protease PepD